MKIFKHNFGKGLTCEMRTDDKPREGNQHVQKIEWSGTPPKKIFREYVAWVNSVNKMLADEWGIKMMWIFRIDEEILEIWGYAPNERPEQLRPKL